MIVVIREVAYGKIGLWKVRKNRFTTVQKIDSVFFFVIILNMIWTCRSRNSL